LGIVLFKIANKILNIDKLNSLFLTLSVVTTLTYTAFTIRPDAVALLFLFCTIFFYIKFIQEDFKPKWLVITSLFFALGFFTKQDGVFLCIPIGIHLITQKKHKELSYITLTFFIFLCTILMLAYKWHGEFFITNTVLGLKNTASIKQMIAVFDKAFSIFGMFICLGIIIGIYYCTKFKNTIENFIGILCVYYFILALSLSTKIGSWINYYTPFVIIAIILLYNFFKKHSINTFLNVSVILFSFIFLSRQIYNYTMPFLKFAENKELYLREYKTIESLKQKLHLKKSDKIIAPNQLHRNFLANNTILVNIEYYNQASYKYENIKRTKNKKIKYFIYKRENQETINFLTNYFKIDTLKYKKEIISDLNVYILLD
jgi:hypothetical protein